MKDIIIRAKDIHRELYFCLFSFVLAFIVNAGAIIAYDRPWIELLSQIGYVFFMAAGIYVLLLVVRGVAVLLAGLLRLMKHQ